MKYTLVYKNFANKGLLIEWPNRIDEAILDDIINFKKEISKIYKQDSLEFIPAYNSLTIVLNDVKISIDELRNVLENTYQNISVYKKQLTRLWTIPVCYDKSFGIDIEVLCQQKKINIETLIKMHTEAIYTIYCIGFLPGFMYLGGLPEQLNAPRRKEPRLHVSKGSVGIGGDQTGIYPQDSPGGWNIIGNSPVTMFNANAESLCMVSVGDKIQFESISIEQYKLIKIAINAGTFKLENTKML